ncbi:MAG: glycosyltransferase family 9 protein, partial [Tenacibaculum sp.]
DKPKLTNNFVNKFKKNRIGIAPFAYYKSKSLPVLLIKKLISQLSLNPKNSILIFGGGKGERVILEKLSKDYSNVHSLVQKFSFEEELDIISNLDLMISADSANGHIATMYKVPVITIWGLTHPCLGFTPFNQPAINQILPDLKKYPLIPTSVYGKSYPKKYLNCFSTIAVEKILSTVSIYIE